MGRAAPLVLSLSALACLLAAGAGGLAPLAAAGSDLSAGLSILRWCLAADGLLLGAWALHAWRRPASDGMPAASSTVESGGLTLAAITLLALVLRTIRLDTGLWIDEIVTVVHYLRLPWWKAISVYESANQHVLYSALGSLSVHSFGEHAWSARLPAVLFGAAGVFALYGMARRVTTRSEAMLAAAMLAVSYHHVWYSQSARGYSGMIFFTIAGTSLFLKALDERRAATWALYALVMALGVTTLQNTAFVAAGHGVAALVSLLWREGRVSWKSLGQLAAALVAAAFLTLQMHALVLVPMLRFFRYEDRTGLGWFSLSSFAPVVSSGLRAGLGGVGLIVVGTVMAAGWLSYLRESRLVATMFVAPVALNLLALVVLRYGAYPRSFLYVLPFAFLFAIRGATVVERWARRKRRSSAAEGRDAGATEPVSILAVFVVLLSALPLVRLYSVPKQDFPGALQWVESQRRPGERIAAVGLAAVAYRDYYGPGLDFPRTAAELDALRRRGGTWVLYSFTRDMRLRFGPLYDRVLAETRPARSFPGTLGDGAVWVAWMPPEGVAK